MAEGKGPYALVLEVGKPWALGGIPLQQRDDVEASRMTGCGGLIRGRNELQYIHCIIESSMLLRSSQDPPRQRVLLEVRCLGKQKGEQVDGIQPGCVLEPR